MSPWSSDLGCTSGQCTAGAVRADLGEQRLAGKERELLLSPLGESPGLALARIPLDVGIGSLSQMSE